MLIINLTILFFLTVISNAVSTLRSLFTAKKEPKAAFIVTIIDAIIFATIMKQVINESQVVFILVYAIGRASGVVLGNYLESKIALGIFEVETLVNEKASMKNIADRLRELGYSVETVVSYGYKGKKRYIIKVTTLRKELDKIKEVMSKYGYDSPTMKIKEVSKVLGKFSISSKCGR